MVAEEHSGREFEIGEADFLLEGAPHQIISGALHYFRVHPDLWADRISKARSMGLNAIETYVAWNAHEPVRGQWDTSGSNDLGAFLDLVAAAGLHAVVRPGPYICAEWHNGGLPVWVTAQSPIGLRSSDPVYLADVTAYLRRVYEIIGPRQIDRGGNVILVQIENEYGAYGDDREYLAALVAVTREAGITVPLVTIDQPESHMLTRGSIPGTHMTASFGSRSLERLATLRAHQPTGPLMCGEFWDGWFDWWGGVHHRASVADSSRQLDEILSSGASVNIYMFHGGTNFGLTNGANDRGRYLPIVTSYDYDAPLDEAGDPTEKFWSYREVISRYRTIGAELPDARSEAPAFDVPLESVGDWIDAGEEPSIHFSPPSYEDLGHLGALVRYQAASPAVSGAARLRVGEVRDRAWVDLDGVSVGVISRTKSDLSIVLPSGAGLSVLVEDQGRVNYADRLGEPKGLFGPVTVGDVAITGWIATPMDLPNIAAWALQAPRVAGSVGRQAVRGEWSLGDPPRHLFLDLSDCGDGYAFVNGFFLGRFAHTGPQRTLYVPGPVLRRGKNSVVAISLDDVRYPVARFVPEARLGPSQE